MGAATGAGQIVAIAIVVLASIVAPAHGAEGGPWSFGSTCTSANAMPGETDSYGTAFAQTNYNEMVYCQGVQPLPNSPTAWGQINGNGGVITICILDNADWTRISVFDGTCPSLACVAATAEDNSVMPSSSEYCTGNRLDFQSTLGVSYTVAIQGSAYFCGKGVVCYNQGPFGFEVWYGTVPEKTTTLAPTPPPPPDPTPTALCDTTSLQWLDADGESCFSLGESRAPPRTAADKCEMEYNGFLARPADLQMFARIDNEVSLRKGAASYLLGMTCIDSGECSWADGTDGLAGLDVLFDVAVGEETYSVITAEDEPWPTIAYEADIEYVCGRYNPTFFSETYDDETITIDLPIVRRDPSDNTFDNCPANCVYAITNIEFSSMGYNFTGLSSGLPAELAVNSTLDLGSNTISFVADQNAFGFFYFSYRIERMGTESQDGWVSINVLQQNDPPVLGPLVHRSINDFAGDGETFFDATFEDDGMQTPGAIYRLVLDATPGGMVGVGTKALNGLTYIDGANGEPFVVIEGGPAFITAAMHDLYIVPLATNGDVVVETVNVTVAINDLGYQNMFLGRGEARNGSAEYVAAGTISFQMDTQTKAVVVTTTAAVAPVWDTSVYTRDQLGNPRTTGGPIEEKPELTITIGGLVVLDDFVPTFVWQDPSATSPTAEMDGFYALTVNGLTTAGVYNVTMFALQATGAPLQVASFNLTVAAASVDPSQCVLSGPAVDESVHLDVPTSVTVIARDIFGNQVDSALASEWKLVLISQSSPLDPKDPVYNVTKLAPATFRLDFVMPAYEDPALALRPGVTVLALSYASEGEARRNIVVVGDCGVGWFGTLQEDGTIDCVPCPDATYSTMANATECLPCPANTTAEEGDSLSACLCLEGYYNDELRSGLPCKPCRPGAFCRGGTNRPVAVEGWWESDDAVMLACLNAEACLGNGACAAGYNGTTCAYCVDGFYKIGIECRPCPAAPALAPVILVVAMVLIPLWLIYIAHYAQHKRHNHFASLAIAFNNVQIMVLFVSIGVNWPASARSVLALLSLANFNIEYFAPECLFGGATFGGKWLFTMLLPVMVGGLFVLALGLVMAAQACLRWRHPGAVIKKHEADDDGGRGLDRFKSMCTEPGHIAQITHSALRGYLIFLAVAYLPLSWNVLRMFACHGRGDGVTAVVGDPDLVCFGPGYGGLFALALIGTVVYVIGIPAFMVGYLHYKRKANWSKFATRYSFWVSRYREEFYWWEAQLLVRKLVVVVAVTLLSSVRVFQTTVVVIALFVGFGLQVYYKPFTQTVHNIVELVAIACTFFTLYIGQLEQLGIADGTDNLADLKGGLIGCVLVVFGVAVVGGMLYDGQHWVRVCLGRADLDLIAPGDSDDHHTSRTRSGDFGGTELGSMEPTFASITKGEGDLVHDNVVFVGEPSGGDSF